jgi:putative membrane protein
MRTKWLNAGLLVGLLSPSGLVLTAAAPASADEGRYETGDQEFVEKALGVNQLELRLGQLAAGRGAAPDVKAMGRTMVQKHTELGQQLVALSTEPSPSVELTGEQQSTFERVASQSGGTFDAVFKQTVDAGHVKELAMYRDEVSHATSPQLRELAERRVTKLQETVAQADMQKSRANKKHDW